MSSVLVIIINGLRERMAIPASQCSAWPRVPTIKKSRRRIAANHAEGRFSRENHRGGRR